MTNIESYIIDNNRISVLPEGCEDYIDFCEALSISDVYTNILTGVKTVRIEIVLSDGTTPSVELERSIVAGNIIPPLVAIGLTLEDNPFNSSVISNVLFQSEADAERHFIHDKLGFHNNNTGENVFLGLESLGGSYSSRYIHYQNMVPRGSMEEWRDHLNSFVESNANLQLALAIGVAAPITSRLQDLGEVKDTGIYALCGASSTGKTTTMLFMSSIWWGAKLGFGVENFNMTSNFMDSTIADSQGVPVFFDDASAVQKFDLTVPVYSISSSLSRGRCNGLGAKNPRLTFSGAVVLTSEQSIISQTSKQKGIYARVVEFYQQWYTDRNEADEVSNIIQNYHGTAWKPFMELLLSHGDTYLLDTYNTAFQQLIDLLKPVDGIERRQLQKYAVLLTAIPYIREAWDFKLDQDKILQIISSTFRENIKNEPADEALHDKLMCDIASNKHLFPQQNANFPTASAAWGEISMFHHLPCVWMTREKFCDLVEKHGYPDYISACRLLHNAGFLEQFSGNRYFIKHKIAGVSVPCCVLHENCPAPPSKKITKQKPKISDPDLLSED